MSNANSLSQTVQAPAKLTLSLRVTGVRSDGYHEIDATMVTLDLFDDLEITAGPSSVSILPNSPAATPELLQGGDTLVTRALEVVGRQARVRINKRIPAGAGLGGGSADAAAILRWAGYTDLDGAAGIGADVAFCLVGGRAQVTGIGEVIAPLPFVSETFTVVTPPIHCSTPAVYAAWDDLGGPEHESGNDLTKAALMVAPGLAEVRDVLGNATGQTPRLAGSGSSWFVDGAFPELGQVLRTIPSDERNSV